MLLFDIINLDRINTQVYPILIHKLFLSCPLDRINTQVIDRFALDQAMYELFSLYICKYNITSLSLLAGRTVATYIDKAK